MEFEVTRVEGVVNGMTVAGVKDRLGRLHFIGTERLGPADKKWVHRRLAVMLRKFDVGATVPAKQLPLNFGGSRAKRQVRRHH